MAADDDVLFLRRDEVNEVLWDYYCNWAVNSSISLGPPLGAESIARRREIHAKLSDWQAAEGPGRTA